MVKKAKRVAGVTYRDDGKPRWEVRIRWQENGQKRSLPLVHYPVDLTAPKGSDTHIDRAEEFAVRFASEKWNEIKNGKFKYESAAHHFTLKDILERFIQEVNEGIIITKEDYEKSISEKKALHPQAIVKKSTRLEVSTAKVFLGKAKVGNNTQGFPDLVQTRLDQLSFDQFYDLSNTKAFNWRLKDRNGNRAGNSSTKRALTAIRTILNHAIKYWKLDFQNPLKSLTDISVNDKRDITVDGDQWQFMLEQLRSSRTEKVVIQAIEFMRQTAVRRGEVCNLTWKGVDLKKKVATLYNTKSKGSEIRNRTIPLNGDAMAILLDLQETGFKGSHVFARKNGKAISPDSITQAWGRARTACAITHQDSSYEELRIHDLRHTRITELGSFLSAAEASAVSGHRDFGTFIRYFNPKAEDIGRKIDAIENSKSDEALSQLSDQLSLLSAEDMTAVFMSAMQKKLNTAESNGS